MRRAEQEAWKTWIIAAIEDALESYHGNEGIGGVARHMHQAWDVIAQMAEDALPPDVPGRPPLTAVTQKRRRRLREQCP